MSEQIVTQIDSFISQLQQILRDLEEYKKSQNNENEPVNEIASKIVEGFAEEIFQSRTAGRIGGKLIKYKIKQEKALQKEQVSSSLERSYYSINFQIRKLFEAISIKKIGLKPTGNSKLLLKKLARVETHIKLETKVRKTIAYLIQLKEEELIYNKEIPNLCLTKSSKTVRLDPYKRVKKLEVTLRELIESKLSKNDPNWWKTRIPDDVQDNAKKRKRKNESPWNWIKGGNPLIDYIDFGDYAKIISRRDNWNEFFSLIFRNKNELSSKLGELEPIRNAIMHSRDIDEKQKRRLELYSDDIFDKITRT